MPIPGAPNAAEARLMSKLMQTIMESPPYKAAEKFYNENENDIDALLMATDVAPYLKAAKLGGEALAFMPILASRSNKKELLEQLYRKLLKNIDINKPTKLVRHQYEPGPNFESHVSRGGIFAAPSDMEYFSLDLLPGTSEPDRLHRIEKEVKFKNPLLVGSYLVSESFPEKYVKPKTYKKLLKKAMQNHEARDLTGELIPDRAEMLVVRDLIAEYLAKRAGHDAIIPFRDPVGVPEVMLVPSKRRGFKIVR